MSILKSIDRQHVSVTESVQEQHVWKGQLKLTTYVKGVHV